MVIPETAQRLSGISGVGVAMAVEIPALRFAPAGMTVWRLEEDGCPLSRRACWHIDTRHVMRDIGAMIKTFADRRTQELYATGKSKRIPPDVARRAVRKLDYLSVAEQLDDLRVPPGNRLHALEGDRKGQYAISVNDQWRLCFRFEDGDAFDVEITDYH